MASQGIMQAVGFCGMSCHNEAGTENSPTASKVSSSAKPWIA